MKLFQWHFGLYLIPLAFLLPASNSQAAAAFTCSVQDTIANFDSINLSNVTNAPLSFNVSYTCTNNGDANGYVSACIGIKGNGTPEMRTMKGIGGAAGSNLDFKMTLENDLNALWGKRPDTYEFVDTLYLSKGQTRTSSKVIKATLLNTPDNISAQKGDYEAIFNGANTAFTYLVAGSASDKPCTIAANEQTNRISLKVRATIISDCLIDTKPDINLGPHLASEKNITGNSNIGVRCTKSTPYNIGLAPATSNPLKPVNTGSGRLNGTGTNTNKVPYQLYSDATGTTEWGNNGSTVATLTNGVIGTGDGKVQSKTVYVTVPSADFKPDTYTDKVTINVNY